MPYLVSKENDVYVFATPVPGYSFDINAFY